MTSTKVNLLALTAALVAGLMLVSVAFVPGAHAQAQTPTVANLCGVHFGRDLSIGATGPDVLALQRFLNLFPETRLATVGAGSPGMETMYYGPITANAVSRFQVKYRAEILTPLGLVNPTGYFGASSRAKANALCATGIPTPTPTPTPDDDDDDDVELEGGAGFLDDADFISALNNEDVGEGEEEVEVVGLELTATDDSDIALTAARVMLENSDADGSDDLDDYAESISLWFNGDELDTVDVDDIDEDGGEWEHTFTIDWEDAIIRADESGELVLAVTALENIDTTDLNNNSWDTTFEMIRYVDAQGAVISEESEGDIGDSRAFEFTTFTAARDVELTIDEADDNPDEGIVEVDEDGGDEVLLLVGEFEAEGAELEIGDMSVDITGDIATTTEFILVVDGDEVDSVDSDEGTSIATTTERFDFDLDDEIVIDEGDTVEFEIWAVIDELDEGQSVTLQARVDEDNVDDVEADGNDVDDISGAAIGEEIVAQAEGLAVNLDEDESEASSSDNVGTFEFVFEMMAFGDDVVLDDEDFVYTVNRNGTATTSSGSMTISDILTSNDFDEEGVESYEIDEGEDGTATFTVYVSLNDSTASGIYRVEIETIDGTTVNESLSTFINYQS